MNRRAHVLPRAEVDLDEQFIFLGQRGVELAHRFLDSVQLTARRLAEGSATGFQLDFGDDELPDLLIAKVNGFPNHLIFYRPSSNGIEVVRVLHGARDIKGLFDRGELD